MSSPEDNISQPHDGLVRHTFGPVQHAASFFQGNLPAALVSAVKWDELELLNGAYVDENLRRSQSDLLYRVPIVGGEDDESSIFLYLLFEHQSSPDCWMPLRLLGYMVQIWKQYTATEPSSVGLPPIVPLVLAQVAGGWKISTQFGDLVKWPKDPALREVLERYLPRFEHALVDLAKLGLEDLRGVPVVRLTQGLLKVRIETYDGSWFDWAFPLLADAEASKSGPDALAPVYRYLFEAAGLQFEDLQARVRANALPRETVESIMTMAEQLLKKGREEGMEKGIEMGTLIGQVEMLRRMLGSAAEPASALAEMSREQLEMIIAKLERELSARLK